jgi:hypothetical protein
MEATATEHQGQRSPYDRLATRYGEILGLDAAPAPRWSPISRYVNRGGDESDGFSNNHL